MINDPKEREHYALKPCCHNCSNLRYKSPRWPYSIHYCTAKKKNLLCDMDHDHGCKKFNPCMTPEEVKDMAMEIKKLQNEIKNRQNAQ